MDEHADRKLGCRAHAKAVGLLAVVGWFACVLPSHAQPAPVASDYREKLFVSADQPLRSGIWSYRVLQGGGSYWCKAMDAPSRTYSVVVENESDETLDCSISLLTSRKQVYENRAVVEPRGRQLGLEVCTTPEEDFESATADCALRRSPLPWDVPDGCSYSVVRTPEFEYPPSSKRRAEQAPVYVTFSIQEREGRPTDIAIAASSGFQRLDEAAMRYVKQIVARTSCPGVHYRMRLSFRLDEFGQPVEPVAADLFEHGAVHDQRRLRLPRPETQY